MNHKQTGCDGEGWMSASGSYPAAGFAISCSETSGSIVRHFISWRFIQAYEYVHFCTDLISIALLVLQSITDLSNLK
jgi:hypothetical protein